MTIRQLIDMLEEHARNKGDNCPVRILELDRYKEGEEVYLEPVAISSDDGRANDPSPTPECLILANI